MQDCLRKEQDFKCVISPEIHTHNILPGKNQRIFYDGILFYVNDLFIQSLDGYVICFPVVFSLLSGLDM